MSLPAVSPDRERSDGVAGNAGGCGRDLHLDAPSALPIVAL